MEIRLLRYVVTLAEELHFGRAAGRHHISQQPFGQYIRRLEREVGASLFERTSRRVTPTPAGMRLVAEARVLLDAVDQLAEHARSEGAGRDGRTLRLGVLGFGAGQKWDDLRAALSVRYPGCASITSTWTGPRNIAPCSTAPWTPGSCGTPTRWTGCGPTSSCRHPASRWCRPGRCLPTPRR